MSSQRNPVYSQMVFSGNFLWISSIEISCLLPVLPVERVTAGKSHAGDPGWRQRLEKFLLCLLVERTLTVSHVVSSMS